MVKIENCRREFIYGQQIVTLFEWNSALSVLLPSVHQTVTNISAGFKRFIDVLFGYTHYGIMLRILGLGKVRVHRANFLALYHLASHLSSMVSPCLQISYLG